MAEIRPNRQSKRLSGFDYRSAATYFVTICTWDGHARFGQVADQKMLLSGLGDIANDEWGHTCFLRIEMVPHVHCVMPNHVHLLLSLNSLDLAGINDDSPEKRRLLKQSLGSIIGGYKAAVTRRARIELNDPALNLWQRDYHDHIVRSAKSFDQIAEYIMNNPAVWEQDQFHLGH